MSVSASDSSCDNMFVLANHNGRPPLVPDFDDDSDEPSYRATTAAAAGGGSCAPNGRVRFQRPPPPSSAAPAVPRFTQAEIESQLEILLGHRMQTDASSLTGSSASTACGTFFENENEPQPSLTTMLFHPSQEPVPAYEAPFKAPITTTTPAAAAAPLWHTLQQRQQPPKQAPTPVATTAGAGSASADYLAGGTIRLMQGVVAQRRQATPATQVRTGLPVHVDIASACAAMALDVLALSSETQSMNDDCLRIGVWNHVVPSLMMLRDDETAKFTQIVVYLMQKNSSIMMRGLDFLLYLVGFYRAWEVKSTKDAHKQSFSWTKEQRARVFPNFVAALFESDTCDALIVAARNFMKEQSALHVRLDTLHRAFLKLYTKTASIPHWRQSNRKILKQSFSLNLNYWERQQRAQRKRF